MDQAMKMLNGGEAASILLAFMLLVAAADLLSWWLRRALDTAPAARACPSAGEPAHFCWLPARRYGPACGFWILISRRCSRQMRPPAWATLYAAFSRPI
jgi:hypothetical protein